MRKWRKVKAVPVNVGKRITRPDGRVVRVDGIYWVSEYRNPSGRWVPVGSFKNELVALMMASKALRRRR